MKVVAVAVLVVGLLCNSILAMAEGPVPFNALMQPAGAQPGIPPLDDSGQAGAGSTQPVHRPPMTTGGKIMSGTGLFLFVGGAVLVVGTAVLSKAGGIGSPTSSDQAKLYGAGGGLLAGGLTLIIVGNHRREPK